LSHLRRRV